MNRDEIIKMAIALGHLISESDEMVAFIKAQEQVISDLDAYTLVSEYQGVRNKAAEVIECGADVSAEDQASLEKLEEQLNENKLVQNLIQTQQTVDNLLNAVYFAINQALSLNGGDCESGGCSSCGSHGCGSM